MKQKTQFINKEAFIDKTNTDFEFYSNLNCQALDPLNSLQRILYRSAPSTNYKVYINDYIFQSPAYCIEYETRQFQTDLHVRFHSSDTKCDTISTYLWPALLEGSQGPCVQKGVVIT